jgi:hypothetical protein
VTTPAEGLKAICAATPTLFTGWTATVGGTIEANNAVSFLDTGGRGGEVKVAIDYPSVQVIVVGSSTGGGYTAAFNLAKAIYNRLQGIDTPNATWANLVSCVAVSEPIWLGRDDASRPRFSVNFRLIVTPENQGNRNY